MKETRYEHFTRTGQEKLRLCDALEGWFDPSEEPDHRQAYERYLQRRIRPACDELVRRGDMERLAALMEAGMLDETGLEQLMERTARQEVPSGWLKLLVLRDMGKGRWDARRPDLADPDQQGADEILRICRSDVYALFPFLDAAMAALPWQLGPGEMALTWKEPGEGGLGQACLCLDPGRVRALWREDPRRLRRGYLHVLLHCLYQHPWQQAQDLAFDVAVELLIERECGRRRELRDDLGELPRPGLWASLTDAMGASVWSAGRIGAWLSQQGILADPDRRKIWEQCFSFDDHSLWPRKDTDREEGRWQQLAERLTEAAEDGPSGEGEGSGRKGGGLGIGEQAGEKVDLLSGIPRSPRDYRSFLKPFAVWSEEVETDPLSFDYIYYTLGMERYGNMPLIEPLEYREGHKLEELVIAIDTSGSCTNEMVRRFLEETRAILEEKENFFQRMDVYLIQCDCVIQDVTHIRSGAEWEAYLRDLRISGRAGTDFRPVFGYVEKLRQAGRIRHLKGLIYFTDGDGIYPREAPDYETAFVFVKESSAMRLKPGWIRALEV